MTVSQLVSLCSPWAPHPTERQTELLTRKGHPVTQAVPVASQDRRMQCQLLATTARRWACRSLPHAITSTGPLTRPTTASLPQGLGTLFGLGCPAPTLPLAPMILEQELVQRPPPERQTPPFITPSRAAPFFHVCGSSPDEGSSSISFTGVPSVLAHHGHGGELWKPQWRLNGGAHDPGPLRPSF